MKKNLSALLALMICLSTACAEPAPEITVEATPGPAAGITAEPAPELSEEPTAEPSAEASGEPTAEPSPEASEEPTAEPAPEVSEEPAPEASQSPEASPSPEATPAPEVTSEAAVEATLLDADGIPLRRGPLAELLQEPGPLRVLLSTPHAVKLEAFLLARLQEIEFIPDEAAYDVPVRVLLSLNEDLSTEITQEEIAAFTPDSAADLYVALAEIIAQPTPQPTPLPEGLFIQPENWVEGAWSNVQPVFHLHGIADGDSRSDYAAIILDERIVILSGDSYIPEEEGIFTLRFSILDEMGDFTQRSDRYELMLDFTPPYLGIDVSMEKNYTMSLSFGDNLSGAQAYSMDGGESWIPLDGMTGINYTAKKKKTFAPGSIRLVDGAGNVSQNESEIVLAKIPSYGGGSGVQRPDHSAGSGDTAQYNAYQLELPEGEIQTLSLGDEELALSLSIQNAPAPFSASLLAWAGAGNPDTLLLKAAAASPEDACTWKINGAVLRKLYNSGLKYLLLDAAGARLSLPTEGFTAGTVYAQLKMDGVSTAEFDYEIRMAPIPQGETPEQPAYSRSEACLPQLWAHVHEESYPLISKEETPEMYPLNVYCGPEDLAEHPYGLHPAFVTEDKEA